MAICSPGSEHSAELCHRCNDILIVLNELDRRETRHEPETAEMSSQNKKKPSRAKKCIVELQRMAYDSYYVD